MSLCVYLDLIATLKGIFRFRWVDLQIQELAKCTSEQALEDQLKTLPKGLEEAYDRILSRSSQPKDLKRLLQWLAFSFRPLTLSELADAVAAKFPLIGLPTYTTKLRCMDVRNILMIYSGFVTESQGN